MNNNLENDKIEARIMFRHYPVIMTVDGNFETLLADSNPEVVQSHVAIPVPVLSEVVMSLLALTEVPPLKKQANHLLNLLALKVEINQDTIPRIITP